MKSIIAITLFAATTAVQAEDIDIFLNPPAGGAGNPNILFVLDNTSNWARASQQWPDKDTQGQSEVAAIKAALQGFDATVNVGLMAFVTDGNANENGGYVRSDIRPMNDINRDLLADELDIIFGNINGNKEKRNSNEAYGNLMFDVHNFLVGGDSFSPDAVPSSLADQTGYTDPFLTFDAPLTEDNQCAETVVVYITNPSNSGPARDSAENTAELLALGGNTSQLQVPDFETVSETTTTVLVEASQCLPKNVSNEQCIIETGQLAPCVTNLLYDECQCTEVERGPCNGSQRIFQVTGVVDEFVVRPTGTFSDPPSNTNPVNADEWARFFYSQGVKVGDTRRTVRTYTIDVFNKQQNADHTALMMSMARVGGGKYYAARNENAIIDAILDIAGDVQAVNSTFASSSLPISATNRAQNLNQVFIGMFRPDPDAKPRWFGNLKRYQLIANSRIQLGDANGDVAVNPTTGFLSECAQSFWSFDTDNYWENLGINPSPASLCLTSENNVFSDAPDGPRVEKGGTAQIIRSGNNPPETSETPTFSVNRKVLTSSGTGLTNFTTASSGLSAELVAYIRGEDRNNEDGDTDTTEIRPSLHGDVIHSRPLPITYGDDVIVYYGSNDGQLRAIDGNDGSELWSFIAPEFFDDLDRLFKNSPDVAYPGVTSGGSEPKDYFFDGSLGSIQTENNAEVLIFPTMRRGGRQVYAFDVTEPDDPSLKWKRGCPNLDNNSGCTTGLTNIGQTWSVPRAARVLGYSETDFVVFFGGGYDACEDEDTSNPNCSTTTGNAIYALDALTGDLLETFPTDRAVSADVALIDMDLDGYADYAYAADQGGSIYRLDFVRDPLDPEPLAPALWTSAKVAQTSGDGRKFLFEPALLPNGKQYIFLAIGSGDREHPLLANYPSQEGIQNRFYVFYDDLTTTTLLDLDDTNFMEDRSAPPPEGEERDPIAVGFLPQGWFFDLPGDGEQVVTSALIAAGSVIFSTNRPVPTTALTCESNLGEARGYFIDLLTSDGQVGEDGDRSATFEGGGLPPSPVLARVPIDGVLTTVILGAVQKDGGSSSAIESQRVRPDTDLRRMPIYLYLPGTD